MSFGVYGRKWLAAFARSSSGCGRAPSANVTAAVIVTEWDAFRALDFDRARELLKEPLLVDLRNLYDRKDVERHGFRYVAVGR